MITPEEKAQIQAISNLKNPTTTDALWLCEIIDRLSRVKPTEWEFPDFVALFSPTNINACGMKFDGLVANEQPWSFRPGRDVAAHRVGIFAHRFECGVCEAFLCIRPYIRMDGPTDGREVWGPDAIKQLRQMTENATIRMEVDGAPVIDDEPAEAYLVGLDGYGLRRKPSNIRTVPDDLLRFGKIDTDLLATPERYGVFLPNNSRVTISMKDLRPPTNQWINMSTGLVIARYTTKGVQMGVLSVTGPTGAGAQI